VRFWEVASGKESGVLGNHVGSVVSLAFSPDGTYLAAGTAANKKVLTVDPGEIKVWEVRSRQLARVLRGHFEDVRGLVFSPDGRRLVSAGTEGQLKLWEPRTGQEIITLYGHLDAVNGVLFGADGGQLISASMDGTISFWDGTTPEPEERP
jgi:WD40 repeat protein